MPASEMDHLTFGGTWPVNRVQGRTNVLMSQPQSFVIER